MEDDNPFTKAQTIDPEVRAYVYSLVNALGGTGSDESGRYVLGDDALAVLRDLKRWLKLYDEKTNRLDVARCLAEANLVRGDLLPIISTWKDNGKDNKSKTRIALACIELLVPLTWPLEHEEMTVNHHRHTPYILQSQVKYKAAVLHWENSAILRQAIRVALPALAMKREERSQRDESIIKLVLYFIRNIVTIRQVPNLPTQGLETEVSRSATIESFRAQHVFGLLLTMCSNMGDDYNLMDVVLLEIIFNLIKGIDVEKLWMDRSQRTKTGIDDLRETLAAEKDMHTEAKKKEWSRHGRFGTMIWVKGEDKQMKAVSGQDNLKSHKTAMFNVDNNKKWNKPMQRRKDLDHSMHDFDQKEHLSTVASEQLRNFAEEFLDSGFNPLITNLRKAIEREAERLLPINYRQFFYVVAWFLRAERVRRDRKQREVKASKSHAELDPESYGLIAAVLNQETFITLNRYMQMSWDERAWQDLNASMRCFTEVLLTVQDMSQSLLDEDQEIAENIQNRIFYEETTHDRVRLLLSGYKDQGLGYLDACTELSHVFLKMLERYSRENVDLQIRSKRKARRRKKEAQQMQNEGADTGNDADNDSEHEDMIDVAQVTKERKFDFKRFAAKFVTQASTDTFVSLLKYYKDLSTEQLKRVHRFLHRVAFKQEQAILLYRLDILALLYKLVEGPEGIPSKNATFADWQEFTKQLFKKMFKKIDQRPELMIEMLFSKVPSTMYFLEHGHDRNFSTSIRAPADLELRNSASRSRKEQIGIVVTVLLRDHKDSLVTWIKSILSRAYEERHAWESEAEARRLSSVEGQGSAAEPVLDMPEATPSYISITGISDEVKIAMFKNARLKLLMRLVGMVQEINDKSDTPDATWIIPSSLSASHLQESHEAVSDFLVNQWQPDNEDDNPEDFLRRIRRTNDTAGEVGDNHEISEAPRNNFIDDSEGDDGPLPEEEAFLFPDNPRRKRSALEQLKAKRAAKKRKRGSDDETDAGDSEDEAMREERRKRRQAAARARRENFKSEAYIRDSEDETDEEADRLFFAKEALIRRAQAAKNIRVMAEAHAEGAEEDEMVLAERRRLMARLRGDDFADDASIDVNMSDAELNTTKHTDNLLQSSQARPNDKSSRISSVEEDTPPSSPPSEQDTATQKRKALNELRQARTLISRKRVSKVASGIDTFKDAPEILSGTDSELDIEDEQTPNPSAQQVRTSIRSRGGFVIDDDDDDE